MAEIIWDSRHLLSQLIRLSGWHVYYQIKGLLMFNFSHVEEHFMETNMELDKTGLVCTKIRLGEIMVYNAPI